ncbi:MAG: tetratricopeptide repeat protein, partial [Candidatus Aureabacteria bacterium]|nr:tetratricopeptide repeat protein [Candidatus Auribacterota bacterium]
ALWLIAKTAERRGDFTQAAAGYREVLAVDPGWWETRQALGLILYSRLGKTDEARRELETVIAQSPTAAVSRAALSEIWLDRGDFARAGDEAAAALAVDPNNYQALVVLGQISLQGGEPARAEELFRRAARISGGGPLAHYGLGLLAARDKDWTKAEEYFRDALDAYPVFVEARYNLAVALEAEGKREEALAALEAVVSVRPDFFLAHAARGRILYLSGRYDPAIPALRNALALDPRAWEPPYFLGKCYYEKREDQTALAYLKEAAELAPDNPAVLSDLGLAYDRAGQPGPARETLQRALQANPHYVRAALNLAVLEARGKGVGGEAAEYRRALIVKPGDVAWGFDGEESDFVEKLVSGLDGYLAVGIDYLSLYELIQNAYRDQPILKDLVPILEKKAAQQPLKPQFQHLLGLAYQDAGKTKEAEERFKKALKLDSDFAAAHLSMGYLYAQQGKTALARDHLEAFIALSPDSSLTPPVREYLEGLAPAEKVPVR